MTRGSVFKVLSLLLCAAIIALPISCATSPHRAQARHGYIPHHVAVIGVASEPNVELRKPWGKVKGSFIGVGKGALEALNDTMETIGTSSGDAMVDLFMLTVVYTIAGPIYMIKGGVSGARKGLPKDEIIKPAAAIGTALQQTDVQTRLRDEVSGELAASATSLDVSTMNAPPQGDYTELRKLGFDTVLELSVLDLGLRGGDGPNPPLEFYMNTRMRLIRVQDNTIQNEEFLVYSKGYMTFTQWGKVDAHEFKKEIDNAIDSISHQAVMKALGAKQPSTDTDAAEGVPSP